MKKTKSIILRIGLIMLLMLLVLEGIVLALSYNITYDSNLAESEKDIRSAATMAVEMCESTDLHHPSYFDVEATFTQLCEMFDVSYIFAVDVDIETKSETYLSIGFGKNALQEVKDTRYRGVRVTGMVNDQQIKAYNGDTDEAILHERNQFEDSLVCYMPCTRYIDPETAELKTYDKPVIIGAEISLDTVNKVSQERFQWLAILTVSVTVLIAVSFGLILYFRVSKPIRRISKRMNSFVSDRENQKNVEKLEVKGNDEFALMADSFNSMTDEIDRYINDIDALTLEKHTQEAELNIARNIQMGLLQPEQTDRDMFDIRGYMLSAKDVGGDLYDYRILDDGRIFVTIADVSGKGVSAALFMARAITLINQYAKMGYTPARMLEEYNNTLASQNPGGLFITTFVAIYDPCDGILTYANAGHNIPYILSDTLIPLGDAHGIATGLFEGETYENARIRLKEGDTLFLYTDGVNEAKNIDGGFYSTERLEKTLTSCIEAGSAKVMSDILSDLKSFVNGAEQNDDITMLTLHIKPHKDEVVLHLKSETKQLAVIRNAIRKLPVSESLRKTLFLSAEEVFVNICSYAYDAPGDVEIRLSVSDGVGMTFSDGGKPFDPTADVIDIDDYDHENAIGGLGRFLTFSLAEQYRYEYRDGKNILYLFFKEVNENDDHKET